VEFVDRDRLDQEKNDGSSLAFWGIMTPNGDVRGDRIEVTEDITEESKDRLIRMFDILKESAIKTIKKLIKEKEK